MLVGQCHAIGVQFVMITGTTEMLKLHADNLVMDLMVCVIYTQ